MNDKFVKYVTDKLDFKYPEMVEKEISYSSDYRLIFLSLIAS